MKDIKKREIPQSEIKIQMEYIEKIKQIIENSFLNSGSAPKASVVTFGCQQNENDSEKLKAFISDMGYILTDTTDDADLVIFNTCAVRGGAEERVFGNLGALKHKKAKNPNMVIGICGCMMQEEHVKEHVRTKFRHVDLIFGTHTLYKFPEILYRHFSENKRVFDVINSDGYIVEGINQKRDDKFKAWVSVMYGCNNFCSYCIVPYVRGRERSRSKENILEEVRALAYDGCKEITLLGQNVNSYGNDIENYIDFADLLKEVNKIDGIERIKFMTSHPKDISDKLIYTMAECEKVCEYLHLPFQAGSNRILSEMNRRYTKEKYLEIISKVKAAMPGVALTSDVIVGFPNETREDFLQTVELVREVRFDSLFTFIFSPREGTPAAKMTDLISDKEKHKNFEMLLGVQNEISKEINDSYVGKTYEILVDGVSKNNPEMMAGRTRTNKIVNFTSKGAKQGDLVNVKVTKSQTWALIGEEI
ncbi:MAG: tRNA (N6-isopentenyl adenosine(37)-C2)-methylthiotransferase MiaB [Clostridia bacterium]|nr:tRNA (N6-isopentenyl adenosine(37)-C2)-methylthiotransferase MiaB [Clostridia bacterium]